MPLRLQQPLAGEIAAIAAGTKARNDIYAHDNVVEALLKLYLRKCYLCERRVERGQGDVEHFQPWHVLAAGRAYDWENLHWSCRPCNHAKRKKKYKSEIVGQAPTTLLVDPSNPVLGHLTDQLVRFDVHACAVPGPALPTDALVGLTVDLLNEPLTREARRNRLDELMHLVASADCRRRWEVLRAMDLPSDLQNHTDRVELVRALEWADRMAGGFLLDDKPHAHALRGPLFEVLHITCDDFFRLSDAYRDLNGVPHLTR